MLTRFLTKSGWGAEGSRAGQRSLLRIVRPAGGPAEWIPAAIQLLVSESAAERIGVWLEDPLTGENDGASPVFRGEVWEREMGSGPPEWARFSACAPLPVELMSGGASFECTIDGPQAGPILGPVIDLNRVLWIPVVRRSVLRGLILLGSRRKNEPLPRLHAENLAAELSALLELEEERRLAQSRKADLELWWRVRGWMSEKQSGGMILAQLAESCTRGAANGGVGAVFALIAERRQPCARQADHSVSEELNVRAQSGDTEWAHRVNSEALRALWQQVLDTGQSAGSEGEGLVFAKEIARIIALPLRWGDATGGVLLAGLPKLKANLGALERLELRGQFASEVLERECRERRDHDQQQSQRALLESTEGALVLVDDRACVVGVSGGSRELLGTLPVEFAPGSDFRFAELFRPRDWERMEIWALQGGGPSCSAAGSEEIEAELSSATLVKLVRVPLSVEGFRAIRLEKPGRSSAIGEIAKSDTLFLQVLDSLDAGVAVFDSPGNIVISNARFEQILGISLAESNLRTLEEVAGAATPNASDPEAFRQAWQQASQAVDLDVRQELEMEKPVRQRIERLVRPVRDDRGNCLGRMEIYRETSALRAFESKMMQAEKLASLGQRVTGIMHDLSNPLTTILGHTQRLLAREGGTSASTEMQQIREQAERATGILRQLLSLSRTYQPEGRLLSLNELVEHTIELHRSGLNGSALRIRLDTAERLPQIEGDYGQLQQVLINLLQNAQHAIELSGVGDTVGVRTSAEGGTGVRLEVWDNGPGVPGDLRERIFDPFFTTKPPGIGTGLGLAIVSMIVRQHGGSIAVDCPAEGGARFIVDLPAAWPDSVAPGEPRRVVRHRPAAAAQQELIAAAPAGKRTPRRILVVEDEPTVANLIADVLRDEGMHVDVLADGRTALDAVQRCAYDLTICDLQMPGMDGATFYSHLVQRRNPAREHFLCVTGDVVASPTHEFLQKYGLPHLAKPFRVEELTMAVRQMLNFDRHAAAR